MISNLTRRQWLRHTAAASLLPSALSLAQAKAKESVPFGFSLYGMKKLPVKQALMSCAALGYDGVELALLPGWPTEPKSLNTEARRTLREQLEYHELRLLGLMENLMEPAEPAGHQANLDRLKAAAELGHALAPKSPPVIETILGGRPNQWANVKQSLVERLRAWAAVAAAAKVVIAVKPHVGNALHLPADAAWLIREVNSPHLRLAFDFSHFQLRGLDLKPTINELLPLTAFIHVKDARGTAEKFDFLLPGEGSIDYGQYFARLKEGGYRGPLVVEVSSQLSNKAEYNADQAARTSYRNLAPALRKAGLRN